MARVLVVEDNPQNLELSRVILRAAGHEVVAARDATEAERALADRIPDLILMDIALPGKDGYALTRELRARPETARLPILAVSSFAMAGDAERAIAAGVSAYLTKPVRRATLLERVNALLGDPPAPPKTREGPNRSAAETPSVAPPDSPSGSPSPEGVA